MKCPKCGFISFDDLSTCTKCSTDLSEVAQELHGTGTETEPEFFLGSAIKNTNLDFDDTFSSTQTLPPLESDVELDFDDTANTSREISFSPDGAPPADIDLDSTGDVALELGEIMPIDVSQLDSTMEISALAAQGADTGTESMPDDATMAMGLENLTSQNLAALSEEDDTPDLTAQLADLDEAEPSAAELDETMVLSDLEFDSATDADESLDETIALPELDQLDIDIDEAGEPLEELALDATAVTDLAKLKGIEDVNLDEPAEDSDTLPEPELNLDEIDLSDLVEPLEKNTPIKESPATKARTSTETEEEEESEADELADIDLDSTADVLDLSSLDNEDEIPLPEIETEDIDSDVLIGEKNALPSLDLDQLDFVDGDSDKTGEQEPIVDLSSLIEEEGVQDEGDATIELDLLSDEPIPAPDADSTQDIPEIEVDMTPIDEDAPPDLPE